MTVLALVAALVAPDYLTSVTSPVIETPGTPAEIAARGERCMAQQLGSGRAGGELIISRDIEAGVIVSRSAVNYRDGMLVWQMRSRLTLEARDGRFRLEHTGIERFNDQSGGWSAVGKWWGSGWQKAETALKETSASVASCITAQSGPADNW
jgi:hypothetical protein